MRLLKIFINQWKNPDYNVRLEYAQRSGNQKKLLYLAVNDVHESVRIAAVKNLNSDTARLHVIEFSSCDRSLELALRFLQTDEARSEAALMQDLSGPLRLSALQEITSPSENLLLQLLPDQQEEVALFAINATDDIDALEALYSEAFSDACCLAILAKIRSEALAIQVFESTLIGARRIAALAKISNLDILQEIFLREDDCDIRSSIIERCDDDAALIRFFEDEDDECLRAQLAGKIRDSSWLAFTAINDYSLEVRRRAVAGLEDAPSLVEVAMHNEDQRINDSIFERPLPDEVLVRIAQTAISARARVEAVSRVIDLSQLEILTHESNWPDTIWFAGRRLGLLPIDSLRGIESSEVLLRAVLEDSNKLARVAAIRQIKESWAMNQLANSDDGELAAIANLLLKEVTTSSGIRYIQVPGRSYQLSIFPVTGEQFARWKESNGDFSAAERYDGLKDLPVTDIPLREAREFCQWLGTLDNCRYRLPYFDEWKHAALCDSPDWFSTGRLRAFADSEQSELVLFGDESGARAMHKAVPNPWCLLDMIGNLMEWTDDTPGSEQMLSANVPLDEFAQIASDSRTVVNLEDYGYASGNHWADRRIRTGRWKRLIHKDNLATKASAKIGFRVLRIDPTNHGNSIEYELTLKPEIALGYTQDQVCWALSRALMIDFEDARRRYAVVPSRIARSRDYTNILRIKRSWESCGALTDLVSTVVDSRVCHA
ncbi:formylglycine-generating enzyme family protein [Coraliomargarita sp. W4R53]